MLELLIHFRKINFQLNRGAPLRVEYFSSTLDINRTATLQNKSDAVYKIERNKLFSAKAWLSSQLIRAARRKLKYKNENPVSFNI